jgi:hypothetical protein
LRRRLGCTRADEQCVPRGVGRENACDVDQQ